MWGSAKRSNLVRPVIAVRHMPDIQSPRAISWTVAIYSHEFVMRFPLWEVATAE